MNKTATVSLLAASALLFAPKPAAAGDKELAAIGGFIGGLILGSQINQQSHHERVVVAPACPPPAPVVVYEPGGYWETRYVRVWVAPRWVVTYDHWNRPVRRYVAGCYENRPQRVWVAHRGHGGHDHYDGRRSTRHDHRRDWR